MRCRRACAQPGAYFLPARPPARPCLMNLPVEGGTCVWCHACKRWEVGWGAGRHHRGEWCLSGRGLSEGGGTRAPAKKAEQCEEKQRRHHAHVCRCNEKQSWRLRAGGLREPRIRIVAGMGGEVAPRQRRGSQTGATPTAFAVLPQCVRRRPVRVAVAHVALFSAQFSPALLPGTHVSGRPLARRQR